MYTIGKVPKISKPENMARREDVSKGELLRNPKQKETKILLKASLFQ